MTLVERVVEILRREKADHALIGAAAMAVHGVSRSTADIDFLTVDHRVLERSMWEGLSGEGFDLRVLKGDSDDPLAGSVRVKSEEAEIVDVVVGRYKWQKEIVDIAETRSIGAVEVPVARPAGLVLLKLHAGGPKDLWDITSLAESHEEWVSIRAEVDQTIERLSAESRRLWERVKAEG